MKDSHVLAAAEGAIWAIYPPKLEEILEVLRRHAAGERISKEARAEWLAARKSDPSGGPQRYEVIDGVAVVPIEGTLARRMNLFMAISGGTSTELLRSDLADLSADPKVRHIVLRINSPGGTVDGTVEAAEIVRKAAAVQDVTAVIEGMGASAAYWIATAADHVIASPSSLVGSIGVVAVHREFSEAYAAEGIRHTILTGGAHKADGNPYEPLSKDARAELQRGIDRAYGEFVAAISEYRDLPAKAIRSTEARVYDAQEALDLGLVDAVGTLAEVLGELGLSGPEIDLVRAGNEPATTNPRSKGGSMLGTKKKEASALPAEPEATTQDPQGSEERGMLSRLMAMLQGERAETKQLNDELRAELEAVRKEKAEARRTLAEQSAAKAIDDLGDRVTPAQRKAGAVEVLTALSLGESTVTIDGEAVPVRDAVVNLLSAGPDFSELGISDEEIATEEATGDEKPSALGVNRSELAMLEELGMTAEDVERLERKYHLTN